MSVFLYLFLLSCNINTIHNNRIEDKNEAEIITTRFFECLEKGDFKRTHTLFSEKFYRQTDTTKLDLMLNQAVNNCGGH
ncbi:MAG TPA: hypothetical protein VL098_09520 [Flavipsychrobacter sp.]|nr:hypothetical protein [Flavipsychrobacter sp.]